MLRAPASMPTTSPSSTVSCPSRICRRRMCRIGPEIDGDVSPAVATWYSSGWNRWWLVRSISVMSTGGHAVRSMGGLSARVDGAVEDFEPAHADALVFIGSPLWQTEESPVLTPTARMAADAGLIIGGICGATLQLARAGLLNQRSHTSNSLAFLRQ